MKLLIFAAFIAAIQLVAAQDDLSIPGMSIARTEGKRCIGGNKVGDGSSLTACRDICLRGTLCTAINWNAEQQSCVVRSGCDLIDDTSSVVFTPKRIVSPVPIEGDASAQPNRADTATREPAPIKPEPTNRADAMAAGLPGADLKKIEGKRCTGGSKIGEGASFEDCRKICLLDRTCTGVNVNPEAGNCIVRAGCTQTDDAGSVFYERIRAGLPPTNRPPAPATEAATEPPATQPIRTTMAKEDETTRFPGLPGADLKKIEGKRCTGGSKIGEGASYEDCRKICLLDRTCTGINVNPEAGNCIVRAGCTQTDDAGSVFYERIRAGLPPTNRPPAPATEAATEPPATQPAVEQRTTQPAGRPSQVPIVGVTVVLIAGKRCVGGSKLGDGNSIEACRSICLPNRDCAGFNWNQDQSSCVIRSVGCQQIDEEGGAFYERRILGSPVTDAPVPPRNDDTTRPPAPVTRAATEAASTRSPNITFNKRSGTRCVGSKNVGTSQQLDACMMGCTSNSDCYGFIFNGLTSQCVFRAPGCTEEPAGDDITFYVKVQGSVVIVGPIDRQSDSDTRPPAPLPPGPAPGPVGPPVTRPVPTSPRPANIIYNKRAGTRCTGSKNVGSFGGLDLCMENCTGKSDCYGFNFNSQTSQCVLRAAGCTEESAGEDTTFYVKVQ